MSYILSYYLSRAKIIKRSGRKKNLKTTPSSFITTKCSHNMSAVKKIPVTSRSFDKIKASEMCQTRSLFPRWWSLLLSHLAFNGQARKPANKAAEQS